MPVAREKATPTMQEMLEALKPETWKDIYDLDAAISDSRYSYEAIGAANVGLDSRYGRGRRRERSLRFAVARFADNSHSPKRTAELVITSPQGGEKDEPS